MTQDNQQEPANANKRTRNSDPEHRERIAQLVQRRSKLTPEEAALLRENFPEIVEAHGDLVWDFLRNRGLTKEDAEDLQQETFITLLLHILEVGFPNSIPGGARARARGDVRPRPEKSHVKARPMDRKRAVHLPS